MVTTANAEETARLALARPDLLKQAALIDGDWVGGGGAIDVLNPASGRALGTVPNLSAAATRDAIAAAHAAFPDWRARSAHDRARTLRRWFDLTMENVDDLARLMTAEQGKPLAEARGEIAYAASFIEWFSEEARRATGEIIPGHAADMRLSVIKQPVGVVAAITPWNFPAAMIARKVAPALAVGCTVVIKPSELTPFSALALAALGQEAGLPSGVLNVVTGDAAPIGDVLTSDERVAKFTFTGSTAVGKKLAARCMATVKRVSLELGGNAPFIVFDDADLDAAADGALASKFRNTGQTCVCANRIFVHESLHDAFADRLAAAAGKLRVGDGLAGDTDQGPLINAKALEKVERHVADAVSGGGRVLTGGKRQPDAGTGGAFYAPTVIANVAVDALICREETFGPVAGLIQFHDESEVVRRANATRAGLASYFYTRDADRAVRVAEALEYGMVGLNTGLISTAVAPFGGCKESGLGREGAHYGTEEFLEPKTICARVES